LLTNFENMLHDKIMLLKCKEFYYETSTTRTCQFEVKMNYYESIKVLELLIYLKSFSDLFYRYYNP
jgi:hypothetical protein